MPTCTSAELQRTNARNTYAWFLTESDITQCEIMLIAGRDLGYKEAVLIHSDDSYGKSFADWFAYYATELQITLPPTPTIAYQKGMDLEPFFMQAAEISLEDVLLCVAVSEHDDILDIIAQADDFDFWPENNGNWPISMIPMCSDTSLDDMIIDTQQNYSSLFFGITPVCSRSFGFWHYIDQVYGRIPHLGEAHQGFADNVMKSVVQMQQLKHDKTDSINIEFIALYSFGDTRQRLRAWAAEPANPYYNHDYERRLLVLTEPYMAQWLGDINTLLRPTDEVLLLRATEAEVQEAATTYALDQQLHTLIIDISPFIRMYANYMKEDLEMWRRIYDANHEEDDDDWYDDWDDDDEYDVPVPDHVRVYVYRQYEPTVVKYSDGMEELLRQGLGPEAEIISLYVDNLLDDGHYNEGANNNYLETVYQTAYQIGQQCYEEGLSYIIFDLGIWNSSAVRYMNINEHSLEALMIDATTEYSPAFSWFMKRDYSRALQEWINDWCQQPAVTMSQIRTLGDDYITHDVPAINKYSE